jgi:tRNA pseudouridine13 synthase
MIPEHWLQAALSPPFAYGGPLGNGVLRASPEDFVVDEVLGFEAAGAGPHALLHVRKRGANTEWVARELARAAGCKPFEVGFAGLKDRNAVTTQFFTVPRGKRAAQEFLDVKGEGFEVIASAEHQRKLPRGALAGNRFDIRVREFTVDAQQLRQRLEQIAAQGVPNYFGPQRFGREAGNLAAVLTAAQAGGRVRRDRDRGGDQGFVLSAARSVVFNAILAERVTAGSWNRLEAGDVANLDGRGSVFKVDAVDEELTARCLRGELHPTAPMVGEGETLASGAVAALEEQVQLRFGEVLTVVRAQRMSSERRALRIAVRGLEHEFGDGTLRLRFTLPAGAFATVVLRELARADGEG